MDKKITWIAVTFGSLIGGLIPKIWGASYFSLWGMLLSAIGAFFGIWVSYKISQT